MSKLDELIAELCPDGVEYKNLEDCCTVLDRKRKPITKAAREAGDYPYYGANGIQDYVADYIFDGTFILVGEDGSVITPTGRPVVNWAEGKIWVNNHAHIVAEKEGVLLRFLYHFIQTVDVTAYIHGNIPKFTGGDFKAVQVPVPPLEVQREIVRILDNFTELTAELIAELTAELTARKKQYEYYREGLLSFENEENVPFYKIGDISNYRRGSFPQPYGNPEWYDGDGAMPFVQVADIGEDMRLVEDTKRKISVIAQPKSVFAPTGSIIISLQGSIGRIAITQYDAYIDRTVAIFQDLSEMLDFKYFVYQLQRIFAIKEKTARGSTIKTITKEEFTSFPIAVPSLERQQEIVRILDQFQNLTNSISSGLPAEIEARQKQYEYYRDKLLTFKQFA